jgi:hypothetical protein
VAQAVNRWPLSSQRSEFATGPLHVEFVVDRVALGQAFPCQYYSSVAASRSGHLTAEGITPVPVG